MKKSVFCVAYGEGHAQDIVENLKRVGFLTDQISILYADQQGKVISQTEKQKMTPQQENVGFKKNTNASEGAAAGAAAGGLIGGTLGLLAGLGTIAIPGIGPFIAAGPIVATLSGLAAGGSVGYFTGALIGLGIPKYIVTVYEGKLRQGQVLIIVHPHNEDELSIAKEIFKKAGGQDISTTGDLPTSEEAGKLSEKTSLEPYAVHMDQEMRNELAAIVAREVKRGVDIIQERISQVREELTLHSGKGPFEEKLHKPEVRKDESLTEEIRKGFEHLQEVLQKGEPLTHKEAHSDQGITGAVRKGVEKAKEFVKTELPQAPSKVASGTKKGVEKVKEFFTREEHPENVTQAADDLHKEAAKKHKTAE